MRVSQVNHLRSLRGTATPAEHGLHRRSGTHLTGDQSGSSPCLEMPTRGTLAGWLATGSMWRLADGQHGSDQVVQRPGQVLLGDQDNLVIDAKMADRPSRNRAVGRQGGHWPVRGVPPTGQCRWTRRCQPSGAAWRRPDRPGSRRPSSAQSVPSSRISAGRPRRWRPVGTPGRSHGLLPAESVTMHPQPSHERRRPRQSRREGLPRMTQRHEQPVADGQLNVK